MSAKDGKLPEHRPVLSLFAGIVTIAFLWVISPYAGAILWAVVFAILFTGLKDRIASGLGNRNGLASLLTLFLIILVVIVPFVLLASMVIGEAARLYQGTNADSLDLSDFVAKLFAAVPDWMRPLLDRAGVGSQAEAMATLSQALSGALSWLASSAFSAGQSAFGLIIAFGIALYLTFFLLRDGADLVRRIGNASPLDGDLYDQLAREFASVVRATIKGSLVVAVVQGMIGGIVFALLGITAAPLWGTLMGAMSLIPAIGTGIVWVPVAAYLFMTGSVADALILVACGIFVIGTVDNFLRPILVGRETKMPDYLVLISTLGGIAVAGFNGLVVGPVIAAMFLVVWNKGRPRSGTAATA